LDNVHSAYVEMVASGSVTSSQRTVFDSACKQLFKEAEVDAIMLGGTDLALVYDERQTDFPLVDCAAIHVKAVVRTVTS
jgi:aspartate racemase